MELLNEQQERIAELQTDIDSLKKSCGELYPMVFDVARCKDCKHGSIYCTEDIHGETLYECNIHGIDDIEIHKSDWFCADGERRTE